MTNEETVASLGPAITVSDRLGLRVAGLGIVLDARRAGLRLVLASGHLKFLMPQTAGVETLTAPGALELQVQPQPLPVNKTWGALLCRTEIWELWLDESRGYTFAAPRGSPPCQLTVDPGYTTGEVFGDFSASGRTGLYPLDGLDNVLFVNWLGSFGDVILHASGVVVDGKGYVFPGPAGAGKSTLAASLFSNHAATVLGEDQIILRQMEGRFWIYGTPWHQNPAMCSPLKAPLEKLFFVDQTARNGAVPCMAADGVTRLLQTAFIPYYRPELVSRILDRLALLAGQVPFHTLNYPLGSDPWNLILAA